MERCHSDCVGADHLGPADPSQYRIKALEQKISNLNARREELKAQDASLWNNFTGPEPYQAEGRTYKRTLQ